MLLCFLTFKLWWLRHEKQSYLPCSARNFRLANYRKQRRRALRKRGKGARCNERTRVPPFSLGFQCGRNRYVSWAVRRVGYIPRGASGRPLAKLRGVCPFHGSITSTDQPTWPRLYSRPRRSRRSINPARFLDPVFHSLWPQ